MSFIVPIDSSLLSPDGTCVAALDWYKKAGGRISNGDPDVFHALMRRTHLSMLPASDAPPRIMFVGRDSPLAEYFGADWAESAIGERGIPDEAAEQRCLPAYYDAMQRLMPVIDLCSFDFQISPSERRPGIYSRVLLPVQRDGGQPPLVLCAVDLLPPPS